MSVSVYSHHMTNAPSVTGAIGGMIPMLDAVLVNGISMPSITSITRSGSTATIVFSNVHGLKYSTRLTVSGCVETDYNGTFVVTIINTTTVSYAVANTPITPATGAPSASITSAGWGKAYSGTNLSAYRPASGTRHYLRVSDAATSYITLNGYEVMTDINTGTELFPTAVQSSALYMFKSSTTDTTARPWLVIASEKWVHVWVGRALTVAGDYASSTTYNPALFFGDFDSLLPGDTFNSVLIGSSTTTTAGTQLGTVSSHNSGGATATFASRAYTQVAGAANLGKYSPYSLSSSTNAGVDANRAYPDLISGGLVLHQTYLSESTYYLRGIIPNLYCPSGNLAGAPGDTITGRGSLSGKIFLLMDVGSGTTRGRMAYDITPAV